MRLGASEVVNLREPAGAESSSAFSRRPMGLDLEQHMGSVVLSAPLPARQLFVHLSMTDLRATANASLYGKVSRRHGQDSRVGREHLPE